MAIVIDDPYARGGGGVAGEKFGKSIGSALEGLANRKIQHLEERYQRSQMLKDLAMQTRMQQAQQQGDISSGRRQWEEAGFTGKDAALLHLLKGNPKLAEVVMALGGNQNAESQQQVPHGQVPQGQVPNGQAPDETGWNNLQRLMTPNKQQQPNNQLMQQLMQQSGLAHGQQGQPGYMPKIGQDQLSRILGNSTPEEEAQRYEPERMPIPQVGKDVPSSAGLSTNQPRKRFGGSGKSGITEEKLSMAKQKEITTEYKKFKEDVSKAAQNSETMIDLAERAKALINTGKARSGMAGNLPVEWSFAGKDTRNLDKIYNQLAAAIEAKRGGPMSKAKIFFAKAQKPSMNMPVEAQLTMLDEIIHDSKNDELRLNSIVSNMLEENDWVTPKGLREKAVKEWQSKREKWSPVENTQQQKGTQQQETNALGDALGYVGPALGIAAAIPVGAATGLANIGGAALGGANYIANAMGKEIPYAKEIQGKLPTSENVLGALDKATGGFTAPKGPWTEVGRSIAEVFGSLASGPQGMVSKAIKPIQGLLKYIGTPEKAIKATGKMILPFSGLALPAQKALKFALYGEAGAKGAEALGAGPLVQSISRMAFAHTAANPNTRNLLQKTAAKNYEEATEIFKPVTVSAERMQSIVNDLGKQFTRQGVTHKEELKEIMTSVKDSLKEAKNGKVALNDLIAVKQNLNKRFGWSEKQAVFIGKDSALKQSRDYLPEGLRKPLGRIIGEVKGEIEKAAKAYPKGASLYAEAEDMTKGLAASGTWTKWLNDIESSAKHVEHHGMMHNVYKGAKVGLANMTKRGTQMHDLFAKYPEARKYWLKAWRDAERNNRAGWLLNASRLGKIIDQT